MIQKILQILPALEYSTEASELQEYGKDWTKKFKPNPKIILFPRTTKEVSEVLKFCNKNRIAVVPSGGRTGLAGGAVACNQEWVISLSKMNKMSEVDTVARAVLVQAGAVTESVHHHCEEHGLTWPIDFGSKGSSQVGGNISTNAGGVRVIRYGLTRNWVLGLQVVLANGDILELNGALEKNNTGVDLRQLFIGSEGTLGIITEATIKLTQVPKTADVFLLGVDSIHSVLKLFKKIRSEKFVINAFECMGKNCVDSVRSVLGIKSPFEKTPEFSILLEVERPENENGVALLDAWLEKCFNEELVLEGVRAESPTQSKEIWKIRESITESLAQRSLVYKHDIALPISELKDFLTNFENEFGQHKDQLEVFIFGHIGDGNLHVNYLKPKTLPDNEFYKACEKLDAKMFSILQKHKGSVSAEHGIGLMKKDLLKYSRTPEEIEIFKQLKKTFDPNHILNPGKII